MKLAHTRSEFPKDFLFGLATSAYQIEGHQFGNAAKTHWDSFAATPGNVHNAENGAIACDHYHLYEQDFDLVKQAGFDVYRFSTSWTRVLPDGRGTVNHISLDYYDRLVDALLARNLKPALSLYHWELPSSLADLGGWQNPDISHWFTEFAAIVIKRIGDRLWSVAPINEPWCVAWLGHFTGQHAPGLRDIRATARTAHHVLLAHGRTVQAMRAMGVKNLGAVFNFEYVQAINEHPKNQKAAEIYDAIYNQFFLSAVFKKCYPPFALEGLEAHLPKNWQNDFDDISVPVDWCGINYYTRKCIAMLPDTVWPAFQEVEGPLPKTTMGWEIYPEGLHHFIQWICNNYTNDTPIYITENGMANADVCPLDDSQVDIERIDYFNRHLSVVKTDIVQGYPIKGYFVWSLLDNYEWSFGYQKRFGLVYVDFQTLKRYPKASYKAWQIMLNQ